MVVTAAATSAPAAKTYSVRMRRAAHVGDSSHVAVDDDHSEHTTATLAGAPPKETRKSTHAHIEGASRVLALQPDGQSVLRDEMTIGEFWAQRDSGTKTTLAPAGARLVIERGATKRDARVTLNGVSVSKDMLDAVDHLTTLTVHKGPTDDEVFGTTTPQPVGAEWPVNGELAEKDLRARDMNVPPGSVSGTTKLVAVRTVRGVDCLEIDNHMSVASIQAMRELPPGSTVKNARIDVHMHLMLPIDETKTALESEMTLAITGAFGVPSPKGPVEVELASEDHKKAVELP